MSDAHRYLRRVAFGALMTALLFSSPGCCPQPTAEVSLR